MCCSFVIISLSYCTFGDLLVQSLKENALINILNMDEVGVVRIDELFKTLKFLHREEKTHG